MRKICSGLWAIGLAVVVVFGATNAFAAECLPNLKKCTASGGNWTCCAQSANCCSSGTHPYCC